MLQLGGNRAYLYETHTYSKLFSDIEILIEKNPEKILTLVSRVPARRLLEQLDLSGLNTYWVTEQDGVNAIKPDFLSIHDIMSQNIDASSERLVIIEGLEMIADTIGPERLLADIAIFVDNLTKYNASCVLCIDLLSLPVEIVAKLKFMTGDYFKFDDENLYITRSGYTGEDGFEISIPNLKVEKLMKFFNENKVHPVGLGARDTLRLEAGLCLYGHDLNEKINPIEANLKWAIAKRRREEGGFNGWEKLKT